MNIKPSRSKKEKENHAEVYQIILHNNITFSVNIKVNIQQDILAIADRTQKMTFHSTMQLQILLTKCTACFVVILLYDKF